MNMDRKTLIGFIIIGILFAAWSYYSTIQNKEEAEIAKKQADSIAKIEKAEKARKDSISRKIADSVRKAEEIAKNDTSRAKINQDSLKLVERKKKYGPFVSGMLPVTGDLVIENEHIKAHISPRGGRISSVELKEFKTYSHQPLILFNADSSSMGLQVSTIATAQNFSTDSLYFEPVGNSFSVTGKDSSSVSFRLYASEDKKKYIEYNYGLRGGSYTPSFNINLVGMNDVIKDQMNLTWSMTTPSQEKNHENEQQVATTFYYFDNNEVDNISEATDEQVQLTGNLKWISFKQQFFSSVLIAKDKFQNGSSVSSFKSPDPRYVKKLGASLPLAFNRGASETIAFRFYFGPNKYKTLLAQEGLHLDKQINLGWWIFGYLNEWVMIPIFNLLNGAFGAFSMGLVILLLTIIVKIFLFPIAYKSYLSSAKMRVLKPEMDELNAKYKDGDPMQKQQATMALYRKAGVNPMAGCFPLLLQIPILFALIRFFPTAFELRQQGFLWAEDLSTYDSVIQLPFTIPLYGDHVSLFALLMTISTVIYTYVNQQMMPQNNQFPAMKYMLYIMPVFMLVFLNKYSSGLSYYYLISNLITFFQIWLMRKFMVDEDKLRKQIEENKKKPAKKSGLMERLEKAQRDRMEQMRQQQDQGKKGKKK